MTWAYIAGFFDGEGHYGSQRGKLSWRIAITQNDIRPLHAIKEFLHAQGIETCAIDTVRAQSKKRWQETSILRLNNRPDITIFLDGVRPYLIVKKQFAEDLLRFMRLYPDLRRPLRAEAVIYKTHCKNGHPYDTANILYKGIGKKDRTCRTCARASNRRWRIHGKEKVA